MKDVSTLKRSKLREWLALTDIYEKILSAVDVDDVVKYIDKYISTALEGFNLHEEPWINTVVILGRIREINSPSIDFPSLQNEIKENKTIYGWDYEGRTWYLWLHSLAKEYGWSSEYIAELDVDDALGLMQEILVSEQLSREWEWSLSEIAYPYDKASKKSKFHPLKRPIWMVRGTRLKEPPKIKIEKRFIPVGNVIRYDNTKH